MAKAAVKAKRTEMARPEAAPIASAHFALAEALEAAGRGAEAIAIYQEALRTQPKSRPTRIGLARALMRQGRTIEAFRQADALLADSLSDPEAWTIVAEALDALGKADLAANAFERALALAPREAQLRARLGRLYEALDRPFDAAASYNQALALPCERIEARLESHLALSGLFGRANQFVEARRHAEAALALEPLSQGAHQNLAVIADCEGRPAEAEAHREAAYRGRPLIVTRARRPRRRVLTLASAARANSPDRYLIPPQRYDRLVWFPAYGADQPPDPCDYDVVFNAIADPSASAEAADAAAFAAGCGRPLLNRPETLARTAREAAADLFRPIANLVAPPTRRIDSTSSLDELAADRLWLLRPLGSHGGERLQRLPMRELPAALGAGEFYLTPFHDYRSPDGLYRKYRVVFVDRVAFPYHLAIHDDWLVHYQTSATAAEPKRRAEELRFLRDPRAALGPQAWAAIEAVGRRLDLDFAGVDFSVLPDGRALLFEANATMSVHPEPPDSALAHKNPFIDRILEAFWRRLEAA
jgi:Flp pilus assembly protein TadD